MFYTKGSMVLNTTSSLSSFEVVTVFEKSSDGIVSPLSFSSANCSPHYCYDLFISHCGSAVNRQLSSEGSLLTSYPIHGFLNVS